MSSADSESPSSDLEWLDYVVIFVYFGFVLAVGIIVSLKLCYNQI